MTDKALSIREDMPLMDLAKVLAQSGYFKDVTAISQAVVKVLAGRELGIPAIASMTGINIIGNKVALSAGIMASQVKRSEKYDYDVVHLGDDYVELSFREGDRELGRSCFTEADAKRAGTRNMDKFPRNMLFARAMSNGVKWFCPDIFTTTVYIPEEVGANVDEDGSFVSLNNDKNVVENVVKQDAVESSGPYTEAQIGPDFDSTPISSNRVVNNSTGEITEAVTQPVVVKKEDPKKPELKADETAISAEFVEGALEYRTENKVKMVKWGDKWWRPALEVTGKGMTPALTDSLLALFPYPKAGKPNDGKPNQYEAGKHLDKHFKVKLWSSLTWEQVSAVFSWKKFGIPDKRWYAKEYEEWSAKDSAKNGKVVESEPVAVASVSAENPVAPVSTASPVKTVREFYDINEVSTDALPKDEVDAFVANMEKLEDPTVLLPLLVAGMTIGNPKHAEHFFQTAQLLADKSVDVVLDENNQPDGEWKNMLDYIIGEATGTK